MGPKGRNVIISKSFGSPQVTKDGVSVAKEIELEDALENMGAQMVKEVASKTNDLAGDGTTTATVLAQAIVKEGLKNVASGANPMDLKRGIDKAVVKIVEHLAKQAKEVGSSSEKIKQVASISANNDETIGELIAQAFENKDIEACYGNLYFVHPNDLKTPVRYYNSNHFHRWMMRLGYAPPHPTFYCRKSIYQRHPLFELDLKIAADFELMLRLIYVQRLTTIHIPHNLVTMRLGGASTAGWKSYWQGLKDRLKALKKNEVYSNLFLLSFPYCYKAVQMLKSRFK